MSTIRFPKIGMITKRDGQYDIDPIPSLRGPFDTVTEHFETWGKNTKFPCSEAEMRPHLPVHLADEIIESTFAFLQRIAEEGFDTTIRNEGPFPLRHTDLLNSNILVDDEYNVLSVIGSTLARFHGRG